MLHGIRLDSGNALWYKNKLVDGNDSVANTSVTVADALPAVPDVVTPDV